LNIKMMANSPAAVVAAFSSSSRPVAVGNRRWAAIPTDQGCQERAAQQFRERLPP
jgi:hypothetical protein